MKPTPKRPHSEKVTGTVCVKQIILYSKDFVSSFTEPMVDLFLFFLCILSNCFWDQVTLESLSESGLSFNASAHLSGES